MSSGFRFMLRKSHRYSVHIHVLKNVFLTKANHQLIGACHHNSLQKRPLFVIAFILKCYCDMILQTKSCNLDVKTKH